MYKSWLTGGTASAEKYNQAQANKSLFYVRQATERRRQGVVGPSRKRSAASTGRGLTPYKQGIATLTDYGTPSNTSISATKRGGNRFNI